MTASKKLISFLNKNEVPFQVITHPRRETACETAEAEFVLPSQFAKTVIVKVNGSDVLFVLPASRRLDLFKISEALRTKDVWVEEEKILKDIFPDCEKGAMPPFGVLYGLATYADVELENQKEIDFNAGSHRECVRVSMADFLRLAEAEIGDYSLPNHYAEVVL
jgi:Ala-tRNA(Pro) deacylase